MFAEEALREFPLLREQSLLLEQRMHPGNGSSCAGVFDAVPGFGIVAHNLAGTAATFNVELVENHIKVPGHTEAVLSDSTL